MQTKQITIKSNVLDNCGYTVGEVIKYLSQFNSDDELVVCFNEGADTHGVDIETHIVRNVPLTEEEIREKKIMRVKEKIKQTENSIDFYIKRESEHRIKECKLYERLAAYKNELLVLTDNQ